MGDGLTVVRAVSSANWSQLVGTCHAVWQVNCVGQEEKSYSRSGAYLCGTQHLLWCCTPAGRSPPTSKRELPHVCMKQMVLSLLDSVCILHGDRHPQSMTFPVPSDKSASLRKYHGLSPFISGMHWAKKNSVSIVLDMAFPEETACLVVTDK